jgi:hypothetical protein
VNILAGFADISPGQLVMVGGVVMITAALRH